MRLILSRYRLFDYLHLGRPIEMVASLLTGALDCVTAGTHFESRRRRLKVAVPDPEVPGPAYPAESREFGPEVHSEARPAACRAFGRVVL